MSWLSDADVQVPSVFLSMCSSEAKAAVWVRREIKRQKVQTQPHHPGVDVSFSVSRASAQHTSYQHLPGHLRHLPAVATSMEELEFSPPAWSRPKVGSWYRDDAGSDLAPTEGTVL